MKHSDHKPAVTIIRYSCITGQAVWVYQGPSVQAARAAYRRSCEREIKRVRRWKKTVAERKANILHIINACMAGIPIMGGMTVEQMNAARQLQSIANKTIPCCRDFYDHIMEERRRRDADRRLREQMRNR